MVRLLPLMAGLCCLSLPVRAQTAAQSLVRQIGNAPDDFEGEITVVSVQTSSGSRLGDRLSYDGKHVDKKFYKNGNLHQHDVRMHVHLIANRSENRCIVYSDETRSGVEYPLDKMPEMQPENVAVMDIRVTTLGMKVDTTVVYERKAASVMGMDCEASKRVFACDYQSALSRNSNGRSDASVETWTCVAPEYKDMVMKQVLDLKYSFQAITTSKSTTYFSGAVTDIRNLAVSDDEFQPPHGYQIAKVRTYFTAQNKLKDILKETEKLLKKKKLHPSQLEDNDTFETEGEWED